MIDYRNVHVGGLVSCLIDFKGDTALNDCSLYGNVGIAIQKTVV